MSRVVALVGARRKATDDDASSDSFARVVPHFSKSYWNVVFSLLFEQGLNFRYARLVRTCRGNVFSNNSIDRIGFKRLSIRKIRYSEFCAVK